MIKLNILDIFAFILVGIVVVSILWFLVLMAVTMTAEFIVAIIMCFSGFVFIYCLFRVGFKIAKMLDE